MMLCGRQCHHSMIEIIDDLLPTIVFDDLSELFLNDKVLWNYGEVVNENQLQKDVSPLDNYQFYHLLYFLDQPQSKHYDNACVVMNWIKYVSMAKMKVNMNPRTSTIIEHGFHVDVPFKCKTSIFYLNTNNGYTLFEDGTKVESIGNRLVTFDSHIKHSGTSCTDQKCRLVLNMNYFPFNEIEKPS